MSDKLETGTACTLRRQYIFFKFDHVHLVLKSSYFNLVFKSNVGSVKLWESLGFQRVATLENAAALEGLEVGELDTAYSYRYDLETLPKDYLGIPPQI